MAMTPVVMSSSRFPIGAVAQESGGRIASGGFARGQPGWLEMERSTSRRSPGKSPGPTREKTPTPTTFARKDGRGKERDGLDRKLYGETEPTWLGGDRS